MSNQKVVFGVEDMHCESCPKLIKITLEEINGVVEVGTSLESKTVEVSYDPSKTSVGLLMTAIGEIGYTATVK